MILRDQGDHVIPGPDAPVGLAIDPETLATLQRLQRDYGDTVRMTTNSGRIAIFLNDASDVRQLLTRNHARYKKGPGFERVKMLLGNGLIVSDGAIWRRSRRMIQPAFSRQNINHLVGTMAACAQSRATAWQGHAEAGESIAITQEMNDFALELILRCIFGQEYDAMHASGADHPFAFLSKESARDLRIVMQVRESRKVLTEMIEARRKNLNVEHFDFLSMYMNAVDKDGAPYSDDELLDELITLMVAGYETSAGTLNWAWYLIATHPEVEDLLLQEAVATLGECDNIDSTSLAEMHYTQQVLEETLRLFPPVWLFTRRATDNDSLQHVEIPSGADIYLSPFILHRSERYWADPEQFEPQRFALDGGKYKKGERPYFPFSLGPRRCLGEYFSFLEMKVHLGLLIQKFHMTLVSEDPPPLELGINLRSQDNIVLRPTLR